MKITDATGSNRGVKVDVENRLSVFAVSEATDRHINRIEHHVWSLPFEAIDPVGADDYFFYIKNTGSKDLSITDIRIESSVIGTVECHHVTGTPTFTAGTDVTGVNRYLGNTNAPDATIKTDTDTTGLTNAGTVFYINCDTADKLFHLRTTSNIVIPAGQQFALLWDQATGILKGIVSLVEIEG